jgi:hypothetical protein
VWSVNLLIIINHSCFDCQLKLHTKVPPNTVPVRPTKLKLPVPPPAVTLRGGHNLAATQLAAANTTLASGATGSTLRAEPGVKGAAQASDSSDSATRAKEYLRAAADKKVREIIASMGDDALPYSEVRKDNKKSLAAKDMRTQEEVEFPDLGSMTSLLDGRMRIIELNVNLGQKMTWSTCFERRNMECFGCNQHLNSTAFPRRGSGGKGGLQAIWLTDQSMPPILLSPTQLSCIKIVRLEHGMLSDMAEGLVRLLSGRQVALRSVILLCSATNMAAVGTAAYIADLMSAIKHLRVHLSDHLLYGPLPCAFLNGCDDAATLRTAFEVSTWAVTAFGRSYALVHSSFRLVDQQLTTRGTGGIQAEYWYRLRLPLVDRASMSTGATITMVSGCWENLPNKVKPATVRDEKEVVVAIIEKLRTNMAIDLEPHPTVDCWPPALVKPAGGGGPLRTFLLVGSSHAGKLAAALRTSDLFIHPPSTPSPPPPQ